MTDAHLTSEFLQSAICGLSSVVRINQGWEITLPQVYHTGQAASVVVAGVPGGYLVHDNSYAAMLVAQFGHSVSALARDALGKAISHYGCELDGLRVIRRCSDAREIALAAMLVGSASRLIADELLTADKVPLFDFRAKVVTKASEIIGTNRIRTNQDVKGHLGATYQISAVVLDASMSRPVAFLEPISSRDAVARRFKEFYDISRNEAYAAVERVAVYDDAKSISGSDILLMQEVSNPVRFSDTAKRFAAWATVQ